MPPLLRLKFRPKKVDAAAAARIFLQTIRDSADVFPPLKSAASTALAVWDMSEKVKSNKEDCRCLAKRTANIMRDIVRQTKDYGDRLPAGVQEGIAQIEVIFNQVVTLMQQLHGPRWAQYIRQEANKNRIEQSNKLLDDAVRLFEVNLQMSILLSQIELDDVSRGRHSEILDVSRMTEKEREQLLTKLFDHARFGSRALFFFFFLFSNATHEASSSDRRSTRHSIHVILGGCRAI